MKTLQPGAWGFLVGSVLTMIVGFAWGGWMTHGSALRMALHERDEGIIAALVPVCLEKSKADPHGAKKLAELRAMTSSWEQRDAVVRDGWATIGSGEANRDVAEECAEQLVKVAGKS